MIPDTLTRKVHAAIQNRNERWKSNSQIPRWVSLCDVGLDQFFTKREVAGRYFDSVLRFLQLRNIDPKDCLFVEPSAGSGSFFDLLPPSQRIGIDICPLRDDIVAQDFLEWSPPRTSKRIVAIGNPPFGYRGWLALLFMNHLASFAEFVFMILPMAFQSDGKGNPKDRVKGLRLIHSEIVPPSSFEGPDGVTRKINALWQVWEKGDNLKVDVTECDDWIDIFTVDQRKERLCGHKKMTQANYFLQRTYYHSQPDLVRDFAEVKYVCGYGLIFKRSPLLVEGVLRAVDWDNYSNLAAHNCRHISMYHVKRALIDGGILND
jgi:hypothetical protein